MKMRGVRSVTEARRLLVVGHGLIGSAVQRYASGLEYRSRIEWSSRERVGSQLKPIIDSFIGESKSWAIAWCAGNATVNSTEAELNLQATYFDDALDLIASASNGSSNGRVFLASSAGGIYGSGVTRYWCAEDSPTPRSPYGHMKVRQEFALTRFSQHTSIPTLSGRIANAYGTAQNPQKAQGLISAALRSMISRTPLQIHVPLEASRDYIFADDLGRFVDRWVRSDIPETGVVLLATGRPVSIYEVLRCVRLVAKRTCPFILRQPAHANLQPLHIRLIPSASAFDEGPPTSLEHGVSAVWNALLRNIQRPRNGALTP